MDCVGLRRGVPDGCRGKLHIPIILVKNICYKKKGLKGIKGKNE